MSNWEKKIHVKSSMERKDSQWSLFIGRWQPLHEGHKQLFRQTISEGRKVCVAIRDGEVNEKNPFSPFQVMTNIFNEMQDEVEAGKLKVIIIPDICSVEFGRGVGYDIIEHIPPTEVAEISATKIREQMKAEGKLW
jgi:nicotinamide mononucleotide adenylyltransferase